MPQYHPINAIEECSLRRSVIGIDGIYNDDDGSLDPTRHSLISNSYFERERRRERRMRSEITPDLGYYQTEYESDDDRDHRPSSLKMIDQSSLPPPPPERMFTSETPIDVYNLGPEPVVLNDFTKIILTLSLFIIASCFFHAFMLYNDRNREWVYYLKAACISLFLFVMVMWVMEINVSNIYS